MNKRLKRIIAIALTISAFSAIEPTKYFNMTTTKAYASSSHVSDLEVNKTDSTRELKLYRDDDYDNTTEFRTSRSEYYAKTTLKSVNLTFDTESNYITRVFADDNKRSTAFESGEEIELGKGTTTLYVRSYKESRFDKNNVKNDVADEYEIHIKRTSDSSDNDIYLSKISLDYGKISFSKTKTSYDVDVNSSVDEIEIKAKPDDDDYTVRIDGNEVTDYDDYEDIVSLKKGKNEIEIEVTDEDDNENIYTLNIYRGGRDSSTSSSSNSGKYDTTQDEIYLDNLNLNDGDIKLDFNKRITSYDVIVKSSVSSITLEAEPEDSDDLVRVNNSKVNSKNEKTVDLELNKKNVVKVKVSNDDDDERTYTLNITRGTVSPNTTTTPSTNQGGTSTTTPNTNTNNTPGTSTTNKGKWIKNSAGKWQYYNESGTILKKQWLKANNGKWYYVDESGNLVTGWLKTADKWYYLNSDGSMLVGWAKLNGTWYYFNNDGSMAVGWAKPNTTWYYFNADGSMRTTWLQEGSKKYYLNSDGSMQTGSKTINGVVYNFKDNGELK